jgi:O-glycosyl hydrolase
MREYPEWSLWQTEYCVMDGPDGKGGTGRDLGMNTALDVARVIHYDLTLANASAWQWWTAVSEADYKDGLIYTDWQKPGDPESVYPSKLLWVLGNYSRFIRPGTRRVELAGDGHGPKGVLGSAFVDQTHRRVVAVYVNEDTQTHRILPRVEISAGWRLAGVDAYLTSGAPEDDLRLVAHTRRLDAWELPPRSVTTLVLDFAIQRNQNR